MRPAGKLLLLSLGVMAILGFGCNGAQESGSSPSSDFVKSEVAPQGAEGTLANQTNQNEFKSQIIYTAQVSLTTTKLNETVKEINRQIQLHQGYASRSEVIGRSTDLRTALWTVRVPSKNYSSFLDSIRSSGEVTSAVQTSKDVSEEYYDLKSRLRNKKRQEERLLELMDRSTGSLTQVLQVEKELARIREEIERMEGRVNFLNNQVSYSTVEISVSEVSSIPASGKDGLWTDVTRTFEGSVNSLGDAGKAFLLFLVAFVPWLLPMSVFTGLLVFLIKRQKKPAPPAQPVESP